MAAWFPSYRTEFADNLGLIWRMDIEEWLAEQGEITEMKDAGDPLSIEFFSDSDELFDSPVKGSKADLTILSETDFQYISMYSGGNFEKRMSIYHGETLFWRGFVLPESYSEPYDGTYYPVTISAADGLGLLKTIKYDDDGTAYTGRKTISQILIDILAKIKITEFTEYVNIYEERMSNGATDSPFDQVLVDVDVFAGMWCYEVLQDILKPFNALIRQYDGIMTIYRPVELKQASIYGRHFTGPSTHSAASNLVPEQFFNRAATPSDRLIINGGNMNIVPSAKNVILHQDYGYKDNWIRNGGLTGASYDQFNEAERFEHWTNTASPYGQVDLITDAWNLSDEPDGAIMTANATQRIRQMSQTFAHDAKASETDVLVIEYKYLHINYYGDKVKYVRTDVVVKSNASTPHYLRILTDQTCDWTTTPSNLDFGNETVNAGSTGWKTFQRVIAGLPDDGPYTITIYNSFNIHDQDHIMAIRTAFKDVRFYATSDDITFKKRKISKFGFVLIRWTAIIHVDNKETIGKDMIFPSATEGADFEEDYRLGDVTDSGIENVVPQFQGCLTLPSGDFTEEWSTRDPGNEQLPLMMITGGDLQMQYSRPRQVERLPVLEGTKENNSVHINILGNFQDPLNKYSGNNRVFVLNSADFNVKQRKWDIDLIELV